MKRTHILSLVVASSTLFLSAYASADSRLLTKIPFAAQDGFRLEDAVQKSLSDEGNFLASRFLDIPVTHRGQVLGHVHDLWLDKNNRIAEVAFLPEKNADAAKLMIVNYNSLKLVERSGVRQFEILDKKHIHKAPQDPYSMGVQTTLRDFLREGAHFVSTQEAINLHDMVIDESGRLAFVLLNDADASSRRAKLVAVDALVPMECGGGFVLDLSEQELARLPGLSSDSPRA